MSEHPSDPGARSDNTGESPPTATPPRHRISWAAILGWSLLLVVVATVGLLLATGRRMGKYEAEVVLQIHPVQPWILLEGAADARKPESLEMYCRTQVVLARSPPVLSAALKDPKAAALPSVKGQFDPADAGLVNRRQPEWMAGRLKVDFSQGPEFMRLSMRGDDEQDLTVLLDAIVNAYLSEAVYRPHNRRLARIDRHLEHIAANNQNRIVNQKNALRELQRAAGAADRKPVQDINDRDLNFDAIMNQIQQTEGIDRDDLAALRREVERNSPPRVQRLGDGVTIRKVK